MSGGVYDKMVRREPDPELPDPLVPEPSGGVSLSRGDARRRGLNPAFNLTRRLAAAKPQVRRGRRRV